MTQRPVAERKWASKGKTALRERFKADMERAFTWKELEEEVYPVNPRMTPGDHAKEADVAMLPTLLHGEESEVIGDRAYCSEPDREELEDQGVRLLTPKKKPVGGELTESDKARNRKLSGRRAIGEHPFHSSYFPANHTAAPG
jgi:hypothetical protein